MNGPVNFPLLESSANNHSIVRTWLMFYAFDRKTNNMSIRRTLHVEKGTTGKQAANVALSRCRQTSADVRFRAAATTAAAAAALSPSCRRLRAAAAAVPPFVGWLLRFVRRPISSSSCDHQRSRCRPLSPINCLPPPPPPPPWSNSPSYIGEESAMICW